MWYKDCQIPISFRNVTGETQKGLASVLDVTCIKCNSLCAVHTNVYNPVNKSYEVNGKLAFGMIDASVGECHINTVLSATDVPTVLPTTMKKYERQVGVAQESCLEAVRLEKQMTLKNESIENK
ncbi:uncharacterized protein LOC131675149 [Phymastichus coffea]|uniref:uncharacterized protein LOC131675149 n=1 Tax=Phymastichus coffea TaxID=108790 RepID=UPI00273C6640|nr:uncharacterized protein LOC131675149 [Phymastichus coffea]